MSMIAYNKYTNLSTLHEIIKLSESIIPVTSVSYSNIISFEKNEKKLSRTVTLKNQSDFRVLASYDYEIFAIINKSGKNGANYEKIENISNHQNNFNEKWSTTILPRGTKTFDTHLTINSNQPIINSTNYEYCLLTGYLFTPILSSLSNTLLKQIEIAVEEDIQNKHYEQTLSWIRVGKETENNNESTYCNRNEIQINFLKNKEIKEAKKWISIFNHYRSNSEKLTYETFLTTSNNVKSTTQLD